MLSSHNWLRLISPDFNLRNLFTLNWEALGSGLTSFGGLQPATESLWMSDIAHHHLAVGVVFILAGHMYQTDFGIGVALGDIIADHKLELFNSCHLQLALQLAMQGSVSVWVGHVLVALPAYPYLLTDYATVLSVFTHQSALLPRNVSANLGYNLQIQPSRRSRRAYSTCTSGLRRREGGLGTVGGSYCWCHPWRVDSLGLGTRFWASAT